MEEIEVPLEQVHEEIHHQASHGGPSWFTGVALSSAILAALAAVAALMAGHYSNEAMLEQIRASDSWSYYQAKGVKAAVLSAKLDLIQSLKASAKAEDKEKIKTYKEEQEEISEKAKELEKESAEHLHKHVTLARSVTLFQVAIAISAISVLTRKRLFWLIGLGFGLVGFGFFLQNFFT